MGILHFVSGLYVRAFTHIPAVMWQQHWSLHGGMGMCGSAELVVEAQEAPSPKVCSVHAYSSL